MHAWGIWFPAVYLWYGASSGDRVLQLASGASLAFFVSDFYLYDGQSQWQMARLSKKINNHNDIANESVYQKLIGQVKVVKEVLARRSKPPF